MAWHDPSGVLENVRDGVERILRSRLCASTPAQYGYLAGLSEDSNWMHQHRSRIKERLDFSISRINEIDGIECQAPRGGFYLFVKISNPDLASDDKKFVLDLLHSEHVLVVHGSGFSPEFGRGHFRMVCLPDIEILSEAFDRIESYLREN